MRAIQTALAAGLALSLAAAPVAAQTIIDPEAPLSEPEQPEAEALLPPIDDVPLVDDPALGREAFGPKLEIGARVSYDLVDRLLSPYVGLHYERTFGGSADLVRASGEDASAAFLVVGARMIF